MKLVLAEKPSVAMSLSKVIGANQRGDGYMEGNGYLVSWCVGHLVELSQPEAYDEKYAKWRYDDLPILPEHWQYASTKKQFGILKKLMQRKDVESSDLCNRCRTVRLGDLRERKKRPHLVENQIQKSFKEQFK